MSVTEERPRGWPATFSAICDTHRGRLVRWLAAMFGPHDAEDIAQEALVRLYARPTLLADDADPWPWLAVVARNVGRDLARHNAYARAVDAHELAELPCAGRVCEEVAARDDADRLARALRTLSPHDRALIRLRDLQDVPVVEIAARLGASDNAVRQQLFRARRRLQQAYLALGGERIGLLALLGLRLREFLRRHFPVLDSAGQASSAALGTLGPAAVVLAVGVVLGAVPNVRAPHHHAATPPAATTADRDVPARHGSAPTAVGVPPPRHRPGLAPGPADGWNVTSTSHLGPLSIEEADKHDRDPDGAPMYRTRTRYCVPLFADPTMGSNCVELRNQGPDTDHPPHNDTCYPDLWGCY